MWLIELKCVSEIQKGITGLMKAYRVRTGIVQGQGLCVGLEVPAPLGL